MPKYGFKYLVSMYSSQVDMPGESIWIRDLTEEGIESHPGPRYISKNLNGCKQAVKQEAVFRSISQENRRNPIGAVFVQEHNINTEGTERAIARARDWDLELLIAPTPRNRPKGGTAIIIPRTSIETAQGQSYQQALDQLRGSIKRLVNGRAITVEVMAEGHKIRLASVYAHADTAAAQRPAFFRTTLRRMLNKNTILGIDANVVPDESLDLAQANAASAYNNTGASEFNQLMADLELVDVARECLGQEPFYTSHHNVGGGRITHTRIDQMYAPDKDGITWEHVPVERDLFPRPADAIELDHDMIEIRVQRATGQRGSDLKPVDESIYEDETFVTAVEGEIKSIMSAEDPEKNKTWRATWMKIKKKVREMSITETNKKRRNNNSEIKQLKQRLWVKRAEISEGRANAAQTSEYMRLTKELEAKTKEEPSLHQSVEEVAWNLGKMHDVCTAAFYRPWKPKGAAQWVSKIFKADWTDTQRPRRTGQYCTDPREIVKEVTKYWKSLFTAKGTDADAHEECLRTFRTGNRVLPPTAEKCGAEITEKETTSTCNKLPTGKSAGPDRIPNKFYKVFSKTVSPIIAQVFNESHKARAFPEGFSAGIIATLYKKKERDDPRNYRPITLLNGDYKILSRILTARMNEAVVQFVSEMQNGFVPDSFLPENIMLLKLIQAHVEAEDIDAYYVFLDMEKAFDRCSWKFLIDALREVGFNQSFVDYIELTYSSAHPPMRQLYINGYLGPKFPLGSGVAQGDPVSPLLFLLITEPLTRMFVRDARLKGVTVDSVKHVISQYADDSTLICSPGDEAPAKEIIKVWTGGTAMAENESKREGMLLGKLNRERERAPKGVIEQDAWIQDGAHIRALGAPMGNKLDETAWWLGRYRVVKERIARWPNLRRLSIEGRNMLLQSIFYGSFRFWLYFMIMPRKVIELIESDAKQILWATTPTLDSKEDGSEECRRWIKERASYLPKHEGGAGIMHWPSHCEAVYATWIVRFLSPRRAPWKQMLRHWTDEEFIHDGILLANASDRTRETELPPNASYIRRCLRAFAKLGVTQDISLPLDCSVQAEPLWFNHRFHINVPQRIVHKWQKTFEATHILSLLNHRSRPFRDDEWEGFFKTMPPQAERDKPGFGNKVDERKKELAEIRKTVPKEVMDAASKVEEPGDGELVAITTRPRPGGPLPQPLPTTTYAMTEDTELGRIYHELWLDLSQRPHRTGKEITPPAQSVITPVEQWDDKPTEEGPQYGSQQEENERPPPKPPAIIGEKTTAFPRNVGWHMEEQTARTKGKGLPRKLSDITIHTATEYHTKRITQGAQPSCIVNWHIKLGLVAPYDKIPFKKIFKSFGTPISDPTEERQWRKLVQRATYVRNRNPREQSHACRLCREHEESILNLFQCRRTAPLWKQCFQFCSKVLGVQDHALNKRYSIIFGVASNNKDLLPEPVRAFLRHAYNCFYHDFSNVDVKDAEFHWQTTYCNAVESFRNAVLRYGMRLKKLYTTRKYSTLQGIAPEEARDRYPQLITMDTESNFSLTGGFKQAIAEAQKIESDYTQSHFGHTPQRRPP